MLPCEPCFSFLISVYFSIFNSDYAIASCGQHKKKILFLFAVNLRRPQRTRMRIIDIYFVWHCILLVHSNGIQTCKLQHWRTTYIITCSSSSSISVTHHWHQHVYYKMCNRKRILKCTNARVQNHEECVDCAYCLPQSLWLTTLRHERTSTLCEYTIYMYIIYDCAWSDVCQWCAPEWPHRWAKSITDRLNQSGCLFSSTVCLHCFFVSSAAVACV